MGFCLEVNRYAHEGSGATRRLPGGEVWVLEKDAEKEAKKLRKTGLYRFVVVVPE